MYLTICNICEYDNSLAYVVPYVHLCMSLCVTVCLCMSVCSLVMNAREKCGEEQSMADVTEVICLIFENIALAAG